MSHLTLFSNDGNQTIESVFGQEALLTCIFQLVAIILCLQHTAQTLALLFKCLIIADNSSYYFY